MNPEHGMTNASDAEVLELLERARDQYENYIAINKTSTILREQCEVMCTPSLQVTEDSVGLVVHNGAHGLVV
jgi:hypothetical protein